MTVVQHRRPIRMHVAGERRCVPSHCVGIRVQPVARLPGCVPACLDLRRRGRDSRATVKGSEVGHRARLVRVRCHRSMCAHRRCRRRGRFNRRLAAVRQGVCLRQAHGACIQRLRRNSAAAGCVDEVPATACTYSDPRRGHSRLKGESTFARELAHCLLSADAKKLSAFMPQLARSLSIYGVAHPAAATIICIIGGACSPTAAP
jgi:hypothetical protein